MMQQEHEDKVRTLRQEKYALEQKLATGGRSEMESLHNRTRITGNHGNFSIIFILYSVGYA